jgi:hypothetical protein
MREEKGIRETADALLMLACQYRDHVHDSMHIIPGFPFLSEVVMQPFYFIDTSISDILSYQKSGQSRRLYIIFKY